MTASITFYDSHKILYCANDVICRRPELTLAVIWFMIIENVMCGLTSGLLSCLTHNKRHLRFFLEKSLRSHYWADIFPGFHYKYTSHAFPIAVSRDHTLPLATIPRFINTHITDKIHINGTTSVSYALKFIKDYAVKIKVKTRIGTGFQKYPWNKKKIIKTYVWSTELYGWETWTINQRQREIGVTWNVVLEAECRE